MPSRNRDMIRQKAARPLRPEATEKNSAARVARSVTSARVPGMLTRFPAVIPEMSAMSRGITGLRIKVIHHSGFGVHLQP